VSNAAQDNMSNTAAISDRNKLDWDNMDKQSWE
jgi:hypothetical protein